jgi:hypothetical protein
VTSGHRGGPKTVEVAWRPPAQKGGWPIEGYRVVVVKASNGKVVRTLRVGAGSRSVRVKLAAGNYRVRVNAWTNAGNGASAVSGKVRSR